MKMKKVKSKAHPMHAIAREYWEAAEEKKAADASLKELRDSIKDMENEVTPDRTTEKSRVYYAGDYTVRVTDVDYAPKPDVDAAERVLPKAVYKKVVTHMPVIDEHKLIHAVEAGEITEEQFGQILVRRRESTRNIKVERE